MWMYKGRTKVSYVYTNLPLSGIKKVFNAMTFAENPMSRYPKGVKQMFKEDIRFQEVHRCNTKVSLRYRP